MDFQSAMETFAEAWVAANTQTPLTEAAAAEAQALAFSRSTEGLSAPHDVMADKDSDHEFDVPRGSNLRSPHPDPHPPKPRLPSSTGKSIPVHCVVEQVPSPQNCDQAGEPLQPTVELDSYAIIPSSTLFCELVRTGLIKLGYTQSEAIGAKGAIHIKNWKPLSFEMITDDPEATVGNILGELTTVATLRIRLYSRVRVSTAHDVKEKLLQLLLTQSQSLLVSAGCPIDESLLSLISKGIIPYEISEDTRKKFDHWYLQQVMQHRQQPPPTPTGTPTARVGPEAPTSVATPATHAHGHAHGPNVSAAHTHPAHHQHYQQAVQKTRMRTSFDPELELPKLHRWFAENQHPTRVQIQQYVRELNLLESRKGRKPLDVNNVVYWFKNARAAHKRAEMRQLNGGINSLGHSPNHDTASSDNGHPDAFTNGDVAADNQDSNNSSGSVGQGYNPSNNNNGSNNNNHNNNNNLPLNLSEPRSHHQQSHSHGLPHPVLPLRREGTDTNESNNFKEQARLDGEDERDCSPCPQSHSVDYPHDLSREGTGGGSNVSVKQEPMEDDIGTPDISDDDDDEELSVEVGSEVPVVSSPHHALNCNNSNSNNRPNSNGSESHNIGNTTNNNSNNNNSGRGSPSLQGYEPTKGGNGAGLGVISGGSGHLERMGLPLHPPSAELARSMIYMASYLPSAIASLEERRKRNRTFIDPVTEVPRLEQWFSLNTHPSHNLILKYTEELNKMPYRQKFPKLEPKNVQFWFKNRRAKCKRLKLSL